MRNLRNRPASRPLSTFAIVSTALAAIGIAVTLVWIALVAPRGVPWQGHYELNAQFANAASVPISSDVRIAGRRVGQVRAAGLSAGRATLRLQLDPSIEPLRSDTRARIRPKGVLGGRFVELVPGARGRALPAGATLPARNTSTAVELLDVAQALDAATRRRLQATLRGLGRGMLGRGEDVNNILSSAAPMLRDLRSAADAVLARPGAAARLVPSAESAAAAFDPVRDQLAAGLRPESSVLQAFAARRPELRRALDVAPSTLAALRTASGRAAPLLRETEGLAQAAVRLTRPAPAALRQTTSLLIEARPALRATEPLLGELRSAVPPTLGLLRRVDPVTAPGRRALVDALPPLVELGRRPCDLLTWARNWRSMIGFGVAPGSGDPAGGLDDDAGLGQLNSVHLVGVAFPPAPDSASLDLSPAPAPGNPYPAPCQATKDRSR